MVFLFLNSTTKETHLSFWGELLKLEVRNENIFIPYTLAISSPSIHVLLKSAHAHAVRPFLHKGPFSKITSFSLENEYLVLVLISSLELISSKPGVALYCSNNCNIMRSNRMHEMSHTVHVNLCPVSETIEDSEVALNDPRCVTRAHPTAALSD